MADTAASAETLQSDLIDLTNVPLTELGEVPLFPAALASLLGGLAASPAPLCEGNMAAMCGTAPWLSTGAPHDS
ncbi:hypothetical protein [Streptomyces spiralis]|uniref:hypothetical protein n=1 Tax=Streptomyces spiralis TaxID=66376 RepID=UPI003697B991